MNGHVGHSQLPGQGAGAPVGGVGRRGVQRRLDQLLLQGGPQLAARALAYGVPSKGFHSALGKGAADGQDSGTRNTHLPGNHPIGSSLRRQQNHSAAASHSLRRTSGPRQGFQSSLTLPLMVITVLGLNIHPAYNIDPLWSIIKCYVTLDQFILRRFVERYAQDSSRVPLRRALDET